MKNIKQIIIVVCAVVLAAIAFFVMFMNNKTIATVGADSVITGSEGYVFFNDAENNLYRYIISNSEHEVIAENKKITAAYKNAIMADRGGLIEILGLDGEVMCESYEVDADCADFNDEYIYYTDKETKNIIRINRKNGEKEVVVNISVDDFMLYKNKIVFVTSDRKMIYFYDIDTKMPIGYFGDKEIADFDIDEDWLFYSDANRGYRVSAMNIETGEQKDINRIKTKKFKIRNGRIFYLDNTARKKEEYKMEVYNVSVH